MSGKKKLEGIFKENDIFEGKYYNPDNKIIFKGKIVNDIFYDSNYLEIYNDNEILIYKGQIENIKNNNELHIKFEFLKDIILCREKTLNYNLKQKCFCETYITISFISENYAGKTSLIKRFTDNIFLEGQINSEFIPGLQERNEYIYNNIKYIVKINNLHGMNKFHSIKIPYLNHSYIIIYVIDPESNENDINEIYLNDLFDNHPKYYKFIYLVITKIDISKNSLESYRKHAQKLIIDGRIYRYFEVSSKTGEGIESFRECLNFDNIFISNSEFEKDEKTDKYKNIPSLVLEDHMNNKETGRKNIHKKLNKYLNY